MARSGSLLLAALAVPQALADAWDIRPSIYVGGEHSDNVGLRDAEREHGTVYEVRPQLQVTRDGPKLDMDLNYRMQAVFGDEGVRATTGTDDTFHYLSAVASYEALENQLGINVVSNITQQTGDPSVAPGFSNVSARGSLNEVSTYSAEPYYIFDLGSFTRGRISYQYGLLEYDEPAYVDNKEQRASLTVSSAPPTASWNWSLALRDTNIEYDVGRELSLARASLDLGYEITPRMDFVVNFGVDDNDFSDFPSQADTDGGFWMAGLRGTIGTLTTYEVRAGEQFYGDSYLLRFERTGRRLRTTLSYEEGTTTLASQQANYDSLISFLNEIGGLDLPAVSQDAYVRKRLNATVGYDRPKTNFTLTAYHEDREYLTFGDGQGNDSARGVRGQIGWRASGVLSFDLGLDWTRSVIRERDITPEDVRASLRARRQLGERSYVTASIFHSQRNSSTIADEYEENGATIGIGFSF